jgi:integrase
MKKRHPDKALTAAKVKNAGPGKYADGNGLYLYVDDNGARRWVLRTVIYGRRHELGLGSARLVALKDAREEAARLRRIARQNGDPMAARRKERATLPAFEPAARECHASHSQTFRNAKHAAQWITTLETYAFPVLGNRRIDTIEPRDILEALTPIWTAKPETARRVKQRLKTVFDYARAKGWRTSENPVGGIEKVLPKINGKTKGHHAALPWAKVPEFIEVLRSSTAAEPVKLGFEFLILTAARTGEVIHATWNEIDLEAKTWTVPAGRMKAKAEHKVPLSPRGIEVLQEAKNFSFGGDYIFPGRSPGRPLSNMAFLQLLKRMERTDITAHGFRSSFRDWAEEKTTTQRSVVEAALAHTVENKVEAAYLRTTLFEKRRRLMNAWSAFATMKPAEKVVMITA